MRRYALLKSGEIVVIWSDNFTDETLDVYDTGFEFNPCVHVTRAVPYEQVKEIDSNRSLLKYKQELYLDSLLGVL